MNAVHDNLVDLGGRSINFEGLYFSGKQIELPTGQSFFADFKKLLEQLDTHHLPQERPSDTKWGLLSGRSCGELVGHCHISYGVGLTGQLGVLKRFEHKFRNKKVAKIMMLLHGLSSPDRRMAYNYLFKDLVIHCLNNRIEVVYGEVLACELGAYTFMGWIKLGPPFKRPGDEREYATIMFDLRFMPFINTTLAEFSNFVEKSIDNKQRSCVWPYPERLREKLHHYWAQVFPHRELFQ